MNYKIQLEDFNGPLDLLLHLIKRNKINILDIPISQITDQYNDIISSWTFFDMDEASEYLEMATRLMFIKSQMILPRKIVNDDGTDPREQLAYQLAEYAVYKEISKFLQPEISENLYSYQKDMDYIEGLEVIKPSHINLDTLERAIRRIITSFKAQSLEPVKINPERFTVEEKKAYIKAVLNQSSQTDLKKLFNNSNDTEELITIFLAILELYKIGELNFEQRGSQINVYSREVD